MSTNETSNIIRINAARVIDAIARIGYLSHAAIMDIVDNSIAADATKISIQFSRKEGMTVQQKNNVDIYRIIDNGKGMNDESIQNALQLGSDDDYSNHSLSKYGLGLKSAGFSLGSKIQIVSKQNKKFSKLFYVDRDKIESDYIVYSRDLTSEEIDLYNSLIEDENGTVIDITSSERNNNQSLKTTKLKLIEKIGVVYYEFLKSNQISITIEETGHNKTTIEPYDILFMDDAIKSGYQKGEHDFSKPILVYDDTISLIPITEENDNPIKGKIQICIFPRSTMANSLDLTKVQRDKIKAYNVGAENKGFFIYRNNRLIRWGDTLNGIVKREDLNFRAKLFIYSEHDDILHVDVSKQNLNIPEKIIEQIEGIISKPREYADLLMKECSTKLEKAKEGSKSNDNLQDFEIDDEDLDVLGNSLAKEEQDERRQELITESIELDKKTQTEPNIESEVNKFKFIRYSTEVASEYLWQTGYDIDYGDFVVINKNHPFYRDILSKLGDVREKQAIEILLLSTAIGERKALEKVRLSSSDIKKVLEKFKISFSQSIAQLAGHFRKDF